MDKTKFSKETSLNVTDKATIVEQLQVAESFINTMMKIHKKTAEDAEMIFEREAMYFKKALNASERLKQCTGISLYSAFLEIAIQGLSIQPGQKSEAYLEARGTKTSQRDESGNLIDAWINTAYLRITAYGELNMRIMSGQIIRMNNPQVIYEGDHFQPMTNQRGELIVDYKPCIPRKSKKIIGAYVCIVLPNNGLDFKWLLEDDIERLKKYSIPKSGQNPQANSLYSSENGGIDPGFLEAKTIKHAMRAYTKLRVGESVSFDDELDEEELKEVNGGFAPAAASVAKEKPAQAIIIEDTDPF
ncbi:MAG: hypothetical protein BGO29_14950 [Bacteroidales bacterium 36-12]|nr:MAG: hypothetical protein BGO29_14950 [Bacteroidales bacterium 36-12]